ncbi:MAG TPA: HAMP domain-containing sensor histidine kinase [Streptosporangiaceae bacterium]|nr:HAMP domain-containing sensor histidine kinase [Streptosporangiaceae bacterium]
MRPHVKPHLRPRTVRLRLTLLYGALFAASGAVLLAITYLLVSQSTGSLYLLSDGTPRYGTGRSLFRGDQVPQQMRGLAQQLRDQAVRQHAAELHYLLVQSGIALAIMVVTSIALGWLVAGRVLRPLRTMTSTIQHISARNLHERVAVQGPRDELKDLADTVDGLLGRLETALDAQKRFVANAAHELRTPLTLEHALLEEMLTDRGATLTSFRSTFGRLLANSEQQARLLEALLTLAGTERGLNRQGPFDLASLAEKVLLSSRPEIDRRGLQIDSLVAPARMSGDSSLVERLVANLLDNAMGYNVPGGRVEIATGTRAGRAVITVANTGPVVPPEQVDRLFEPFQRLGRAAGDGHHGLGLSIVRAIATAHDATLTAHARPGGGLALEVTFPCLPAGHPSPCEATERA